MVRYHKIPPRPCYCFLLVPFLLALGSLIVGVVSFTIKNEQVKGQCSNTTCMLSCGESVEKDCWVVVGGGSGLCFLTIVFILSLIVRSCKKSSKL